MKTKTLFIIAIGTICIIYNPARAAECEQVQCSGNAQTFGSVSNCNSGAHIGYCYNVTGYGEIYAEGCDVCKEGYTRQKVNPPTNACTISFLSKCVANSSSGSSDTSQCGGCTQDSDWSTSPFAPSSNVYQVCTKGSTRYYRCWPGYYDAVSTGCSDKYDKTSTGYVYCVQCPKYTANGANVSATSTPGSKDHISACYIKSGTTGTDDTGTFKFTSDCKYTK